MNFLDKKQIDEEFKKLQSCLKEAFETENNRYKILLFNIATEHIISKILDIYVKEETSLKSKTTYQKLQILHMIGVIDKPTFDNVKTINSIRNKFAHNLEEPTEKYVRDRLNEIKYTPSMKSFISIAEERVEKTTGKRHNLKVNSDLVWLDFTKISSAQIHGLSELYKERLNERLATGLATPYIKKYMELFRKLDDLEPTKREVLLKEIQKMATLDTEKIIKFLDSC